MNKYSFEDLEGKVCVITGGAGVLGLALSKALVMSGVKLAILSRKQETLDKAIEELKPLAKNEVIGISADVLDKESLIRAKEEVNRKLGMVDILVNCAGGNSPKATTAFETMTKENLSEPEKTFFGLDIEGFRNVFDLNFLGTIIPTMIFAKDMTDKGTGNIINISSMNAYHPLTKIPAYSAAKASINNLTEWLAVHFAPVNIRVNAIAPGFFLTNQNRFLLTDEKTGELTGRGRKIITGTPMGKFGNPDDLSGALLYLVSDMARFVTGVCIPVDGGFNAYSGV